MSVLSSGVAGTVALVMCLLWPWGASGNCYQPSMATPCLCAPWQASGLLGCDLSFVTSDTLHFGLCPSLGSLRHGAVPMGILECDPSMFAWRERRVHSQVSHSWLTSLTQATWCLWVDFIWNKGLRRCSKGLGVVITIFFIFPCWGTAVCPNL
jgi:hypothetical protein